MATQSIKCINHQSQPDYKSIADTRLREIRSSFFGEPTRAERVWLKMRPSDRMILAHAAQIDPTAAKRNWHELEEIEMQRIQRAITRLKDLAGAFSSCRDLDFRKHKKQHQHSNKQFSESINYKASLVQQLINH